MAGAELPLLDLSLTDDSDSEASAVEPAEDVVPFTGDRNLVFAEEKEGWRG